MNSDSYYTNVVEQFLSEFHKEENEINKNEENEKNKDHAAPKKTKVVFNQNGKRPNYESNSIDNFFGPLYAQRLEATYNNSTSGSSYSKKLINVS